MLLLLLVWGFGRLLAGSLLAWGVFLGARGSLLLCDLRWRLLCGHVFFRLLFLLRSGVLRSGVLAGLVWAGLVTSLLSVGGGLCGWASVFVQLHVGGVGEGEVFCSLPQQ